MGCIQGVGCVQGPGTCGKLTIFLPRYSQPGLTDSRKAFLWAPSENKVWPMSRGPFYAFPRPPHLRRVGKGKAFWAAGVLNVFGTVPNPGPRECSGSAASSFWSVGQNAEAFQAPIPGPLCYLAMPPGDLGQHKPGHRSAPGSRGQAQLWAVLS